LNVCICIIDLDLQLWSQGHVTLFSHSGEQEVLRKKYSVAPLIFNIFAKLPLDNGHPLYKGCNFMTMEVPTIEGNWFMVD